MAAVQKGSVSACQFHPEKSGAAGLDILRGFLEPEAAGQYVQPSQNGGCLTVPPPLLLASPFIHSFFTFCRPAAPCSCAGKLRGLAKRVIACLDVRANDRGDLVVTKGDQYDVREATGTPETRHSLAK